MKSKEAVSVEKNPRAWANELANHIQRAFQQGKGTSKKAARTKSDGGKHLVHSRNTASAYKQNAREFADYLYQEGITDVLKIKPQHSHAFIQAQIDKGLSAYTINQKRESIVKLQESVAAKVGFKVKLIKNDEIGELMKSTGKIRHADPGHADRRSGAIITQDEAEHIRKAMSASRSPNASTAATLSRFQELSGGRIAAALRIQAGDISPDGKIVKFRDDKGGKTRVIAVDDETAAQFRELVAGKKPGAPVFVMRGQDGEIMSIEKAANAYHRLVKNAREKAGVTREVGAQATSHSFRKVYAQELMQRVQAAPLEKIIEGAKMLAKDPAFRARLNKETGGRITLENRWKTEQLIVSHSLGHNRRDVLTFYLKK
jgi:site-specific recombinase XerD